MERKQKKREKVKGTIGIETTSFKAQQWRGTTARTTIASSLAKKARNTLITGLSRICFNRRSREDKCGNSILQSENRIYSM